MPKIRSIETDTPYTAVRQSLAYWIEPEWHDTASGQTYPAVLLVRGLHKPTWHGIRTHATTLVNLTARQHHVVQRITGIVPEGNQPLGILQPGDYPGIERTTTVNFVVGRHISNLVSRLPGIEMRFFPLNELPVHDIDPSEAPWIADTLTQHYAAGLTSFRVHTVGLPLPAKNNPNP
jgi:hypothetical protein